MDAIRIPAEFNLKNVQINNTLLIEEIRSHPELYQTNMAGYNNRDRRQELWTQVASKVFADFEEQTETKRQFSILFLKKRWHSLRDSFIKYHKYLMNPHTDNERRSYIYYEQMTFLTPARARTKPSYSPYMKKAKVKPEAVVEELNDSRSSDINNTSATSSTSRSATNPNPVNNTVDGISISIMDDDDKLFLLSLQPVFKQMTSDCKFQARIEVMEILKKYISK